MTKAKIGGFLDKYNERFPLKPKVKKGKFPRLQSYYRQCKVCGFITVKAKFNKHYELFHPQPKNKNKKATSKEPVDNQKEAELDAEPTQGKYFWETKMSQFKDWEPLKFDRHYYLAIDAVGA